MYAKFSKKLTFLAPDTHMYVNVGNYSLVYFFNMLNKWPHLYLASTCFRPHFQLDSDGGRNAFPNKTKKLQRLYKRYLRISVKKCTDICCAKDSSAKHEL